MSSLKFQARRATLDDLPRLKELWTIMRLPDADLERQLTDSQVAVDETGQVVGGIAFQISQRHACIHGEAFEDFSLADYARPVLLARVQSLATNHGLVRLWTREQSPFWTRNGFQPATAAELEKLPPLWDRSHADWLTLKLKEEEALVSLDKEFALFVETEKQQRQQLLSQAKTLKTLALALVTLIALALAVAAVWIFLAKRSGGGLLPPP
jgi:N-acetylglutamate synthase-like GNAT family acetyltransferase